MIINVSHHFSEERMGIYNAKRNRWSEMGKGKNGGLFMMTCLKVIPRHLYLNCLNQKSMVSFWQSWKMMSWTPSFLQRD